MSTIIPWKQWGTDIDGGAIDQMNNACSLPIAVKGALMPDAHVGYGLPIGGVLATDQTVIPYAVGVDIACRMMLSVVDMPVRVLDSDSDRDRLIAVLERETRFGIGAKFRNRRDHVVMAQDWDISPVTQKMKPKAHDQLGTSGSGNHFVEYGVFHLDDDELGLKAGDYLAILSHSGSRGVGAQVANYYSKMAMAQHQDLSQAHKHLAWLSLNHDTGREYWAAMELMGDYASANHHLIHQHMLRGLGIVPLLQIENHHNYAWKEVHEGRELIVHRKGATPAGKDVVGIIPGSMASPGFIVRGRAEPDSLASAAHGAGRVMSRNQAKKQFEWAQVEPILKQKKITLLSAGLDELPFVYKDIHEVMRAQTDLVEVVARFDPRIVKMAPPGERPED